MKTLKEILGQIRELTASLLWYRDRVNALQEWQKTIPDPYRAECCDILACGKIASWRSRVNQITDQKES